MRIALGADHAGFPLKGAVLALLRQDGHDVIDVGSYDGGEVDFPDIARAACAPVVSGEAERAVLVCGTGIGASIAANKIPGIRAALANDHYSAHQAVEHDDANVLCLGAQIVGEWVGLEIVGAFLAARWDKREEFVRRVGKLAELEREAARAVR
jgi:ribose 5-phosphate isomerase B